MLGADDIVQPSEALAEDVAVQENQRTQRLILRRSAHMPVHGQSRETACDLVLTHLQGMASRT